MKDQYFGDVNDLWKYALLRAIAPGRRVAICWMLTGPEGKGGANRSYLGRPKTWSRLDPELFATLERLNQLEPAVARAREENLVSGAVWYAEPLRDDTDRTAWFGEFHKVIGSTDLVFFDPDNGLEVDTVRKGARGSSKYLYLDEVADAFRRGASVLIYQHWPPRDRDELSERIARRLLASTGASDVVVVRTPQVGFFGVLQKGAVAEFSWSIRAFVERCPAGMGVSARWFDGPYGPALAGWSPGLQIPEAIEQARARFDRAVGPLAEEGEAKGLTWGLFTWNPLAGCASERIEGSRLDRIEKGLMAWLDSLYDRAFFLPETEVDRLRMTALRNLAEAEDLLRKTAGLFSGIPLASGAVPWLRRRSTRLPMTVGEVAAWLSDLLGRAGANPEVIGHAVGRAKSDSPLEELPGELRDGEAFLRHLEDGSRRHGIAWMVLLLDLAADLAGFAARELPALLRVAPAGRTKKNRGEVEARLIDELGLRPRYLVDFLIAIYLDHPKPFELYKAGNPEAAAKELGDLASEFRQKSRGGKCPRAGDPD